MTISFQQLEAPQRLWNIANGNSGQCKTVTRFLLGLYNGNHFPFDLTDLRTVDPKIFDDCLSVLRMDYASCKEIHDILGVPGRDFEALAEDWGIKAVRNWR